MSLEESDRREEKEIADEEDSEVDEMVDIEKIEDKEEDNGATSPLVSNRKNIKQYVRTKNQSI